MAGVQAADVLDASGHPLLDRDGERGVLVRDDVGGRHALPRGVGSPVGEQPVPLVDETADGQVRIRDAGQGIGASRIADRLEAEGFRPAKGGKRIAAATVRDLMRRLACPAGRVHRPRPAPPGEEPGPNEWWLKHLAAELDMTTSTLYAWINRGWITTRRESCWPHRLIAHADQRELAELRERRTRPPGWYSRRIWTETTQTAETAGQQTP